MNSQSQFTDLRIQKLNFATNLQTPQKSLRSYKETLAKMNSNVMIGKIADYYNPALHPIHACRSGYCLKTVVPNVCCICMYHTWYLELWILGNFNIKPSHTWSSPRRWARTASTGGCRYKIWLVIRTSWRKIYESCTTHNV